MARYAAAPRIDSSVSPGLCRQEANVGAPGEGISTETRSSRYRSPPREIPMLIETIFRASARGRMSCLVLLMVIAGTAAATAQEITGTPGSPAASIAIQGLQLPPPPEPSAARSSATPPRSTPYLASRGSRRRRSAERPADHAPTTSASAPLDLRRRDSDAERSTGLAETGCATPTCTPPRSARRRGRR